MTCSAVGIILYFVYVLTISSKYAILTLGFRYGTEIFISTPSLLFGKKEPRLYLQLCLWEGFCPVVLSRPSSTVDKIGRTDLLLYGLEANIIVPALLTPNKFEPTWAIGALCS